MLKKILYSIGNLTGIALFTFLCMAAFLSYQKTHSLFSFNIIVVNGLILILYLIRREPEALIELPFAWLISIGTTLLPFLFRPDQDAFIPELIMIGKWLQVVGLLAMIGSLLSLKGSMGIVPANRGIKKGGGYRIVRHPLYAAELFFFTGYVLSNQSIFNLAFFASSGKASGYFIALLQQG
jgi:hypothetical protein